MKAQRELVERLSPEETRIKELESEVRLLERQLAKRDETIEEMEERERDFDDALWHAKRGDVVEALFALSKLGDEFLPFYDLSERLRSSP